MSFDERPRYASTRGREMNDAEGDRVANESTELRWDAASRVVTIRYVGGIILTGPDGPFVVNAVSRWIGTARVPFGVLVDAIGLNGTNAEYRATTGAFFRAHRDTVFVAMFNVNAVMQVLAEMFRIGTGIQLKGFADEASARGWLRTRGIAA